MPRPEPPSGAVDRHAGALRAPRLGPRFGVALPVCAACELMLFASLPLVVRGGFFVTDVGARAGLLYLVMAAFDVLGVSALLRGSDAAVASGAILCAAASVSHDVGCPRRTCGWHANGVEQ